MVNNLLTKKPLIYTTVSKHNFFQRDMISKFVLERGRVPLNPFKNWDYFLADTVDRDLVICANNNLVMNAEELWQFGQISNGCWAEIKLALKDGKKVKYFSLGRRVEDIKEIKAIDVEFEQELLDEFSEKEMRKIIEKGSK